MQTDTTMPLAFGNFRKSLSLPRFAEGPTACLTKDWTHYKGYCYQVFSNKLVYSSAKTQCASFSNAYNLAGSLVTIRSRYDNFFLLSLLTAPSVPPYTFYWTGLNDIAKEGVFVWTNGWPITYTNWLRGNPNDWRHSQDCVDMRTTNGLWNDYNCSMPTPYICMVPDRKCQ